jgi:hypothetical protein
MRENVLIFYGLHCIACVLFESERGRKRRVRRRERKRTDGE